jgi:hypothetical protein
LRASASGSFAMALGVPVRAGAMLLVALLGVVAVAAGPAAAAAPVPAAGDMLFTSSALLDMGEVAPAAVPR